MRVGRAHRLACQLSARRLACRAEGGKEAPCHFEADSLRPTAAADRPARRSRPLPGLRAPPPATTLAASPPTPEDPAEAADTGSASPPAPPLSQLHAERADEAPAFAADRSLPGRSQLRCSRPADLGLPRSQPAHRAVGLCAAAPSRTLQPGGQQSHRTKADRGSPSSASAGARPVRLDRRGSARAAAERRSGRRAAPRVSAPTIFTKFRLKVAGNTYGSAAYLLNCVAGSFRNNTGPSELRYRVTHHAAGLHGP